MHDFEAVYSINESRNDFDKLKLENNDLIEALNTISILTTGAPYNKYIGISEITKSIKVLQEEYRLNADAQSIGKQPDYTSF